MNNFLEAMQSDVDRRLSAMGSIIRDRRETREVVPQLPLEKPDEYQATVLDHLTQIFR